MSVSRVLAAAATAAMVLAATISPAAGQQPPADGTGPAPAASEQMPGGSGPVLGEGFVLEGVRLAPGVASLGWDDVEDAAGYELMYRGPEGWVLLSGREPSGGVTAVLEGSSAAVGGLPQDEAEWWFAVRARNAFGVSEWSQSAAVRASEEAAAVPLFDPFTAPTRSGIDLERLREAVATVAPGEADCAAVPALDIEGATVVDPPAGLDDPDAVLTVAEVVRVSGGCLIVEYVALAGRTVAQVRELLAADASVHAVGEPARGVALDDNTGAHTHTGGHHDDGAGAQWHLPKPTMQALWDGWNGATDRQVVVAVLDTGVDITHPDFTENEDTSLPNTNRRIVGSRGCHAQDNNGHGTQMAGIIAAELGGGHVAGVAPEAKILPLRIDADFSGVCGATLARLVPLTATAAVARAVNEGARVINMSFRWHAEQERAEVGGVPVEPGSIGLDGFGLALRAASMLGVVAVTSAGNCGDNNDDELTKDQNEKCPGRDAEQRPALYDDVIAVAAINSDGGARDTSTASAHVDVAAPGAGILTTDKFDPTEPDPTGKEERCTVTRCTLSVYGTSPAAAYVSGVVAHLLNRYPEATVGQVRRALESSARDRGVVGRDDKYGHGIVDPAAAVIELSTLVEALEPVGAAGGFKSLSAGARHSCGLRDNYAVVCWGVAAVVDETPDAAFASLSSPPWGDFVCGVRLVDSAVVCWGDVPEVITADVAGARVLDKTGATAPDGRFVQVAAGNRHVCGVRPDGRVVCWGDNTAGQTDAPVAGFGQSSSAYVTAIAAGGEHTCALTVLTGLECWGEDQGGRLPPSSSTVVAQQVAAGGVNTCVVGSDDTLHCFGSNSRGVLDVPAGRFAALDAGSHHMCAISASRGRGLRCWGDSGNGRLAAPLAGDYLQVAAGGAHNCALSVYAEVRCWGDNTSGQAPRGPRLASLSLTAGGVDLLAGRFRADVTAYTVITSETTAKLRASVDADGATRSRICTDTGSRRTCDAVSLTPSIGLTDGDTIEVTARALFGFGVPRTYRIHIVAPPRLTSLRLVPGPGCHPGCSELELDPAFDPEVFSYSAVAAADVSQVIVSYTHVGGSASVLSGDADGEVYGDQVALSTDRDFTAIAAGLSYSCGIKTGGAVVCWPGRGDVPAGSFSALAVGGQHFCGVRTSGTVVCWGYNSDGQTDAPAGSFTAISAGWGHSCGIKTDNTAVCWGDNRDGQTDAPAGSFTAISAGDGHSCGIKTDNTAVCWGDNLYGQTDAPAGPFTAISAGYRHSCGIKTDDTAVCWGDNLYGQTDAPAGPFTAISAGSLHSCGIRTDDSVACWGDNGYGRTDVPAGSFTAISGGYGHSCGIRTDTSVVCWGDDAGATDVPSGSHSAISAGWGHSCGIKTDSTAVCWGDNRYGQTNVRAGSFTAISAGARHSCGIKTDTSVVCWGYNRYDQADAPAGSFSSVSAGRWHSCGIKTDSTAVCWGYNLYGQTDAPAGSFTAVSAGYRHSCGIKTDNTAVCWGDNSNNNYGQTNAPAGPFSSVSAGRGFSCGIKTDNTAVCWGYNLYGQTDAPAGSFTAVSAGYWHSCGIRTGGTAVCWGYNRYGQTDAPAGSFTAVSAAYRHSCGIRTDGTAVCWGERSPRLEPAVSESVVLAVVSRADRAVHVLYEVTVARPEPVWERSSRAARQQPGASGAGAGSAPPLCEGIADLRQCLEAWPECGQDPAGCLGPRTGDSPGAAWNAIPEPGADSGPAPAPTDTSSPRSDGADAATAGSAAGQRTAVACPSDTPSGTAVSIADATLRAGINRRLDKAPNAEITAAEMAGLTALELPARAGGGRVVSLSGLEHAANLASLDLNGHNVADVSPLACLDRLTTVDLAGNDITDLAALSGLSGLTTLGLAGNDIADTAALSGLTSLAALDLSGNTITDISSLSRLSGLRSLNVGHNEISDITALRGLTALEALHAHGNQITGVAALAPLTSLTTLYLDHNAITGVAALAGLTRLTTLGLGGNQISDITALRSLTALETLYIFDNDVADASALSGLASLKVLWIDGNDLTGPYRWAPAGGLGYLDARHNLIADIAPLDAAGATGGTVHTEPQRVATVRVNDASLRAALLAALGKTAGDTLSPEEIAAIERLQRAGPASDPAPITDLSGLEHATALTVLRLRNNNIADIGPIAGLSGLTELDLHTNNLSDLSQLSGLTSLRTLSLINNRLHSLHTLPALPRLESLFVDLNQIADLTPLSHRAALVHLGLAANNITNIEPLAQLTGLESLTLSLNNITDISPLSQLTGLETLRLEHTRTTDLQALKTLTALQFLHLGHNQITSLQPLAALTELWTLDIQNNRVASLQPLAGLTGLRNLYLHNNNITSLEPLTALTNLRRLHIGGNHITNLAPLDNITGLTIHGRNHQTPRN